MSYDIPNTILVGALGYPLYRFDNSSIVLNSLSGVFSVDVIGNELSVDTFSVTIRHDPGVAQQIYAPLGNDGYEDTNGEVYSLATQSGRDYMTELPYGTPVFWYCGGDFFARGYLRSVERLTRYSWRLTVISGVGLLDDSYHTGGLYAGTPAGDIINDIIGDVISVDIDAAVASTIVNGWLPYATRRQNLHRLLFAVGAQLIRAGETTDYRVIYAESAAPTVIDAGRIDVRGSVSYQLPATAAEVTEHAFFQTADDAVVTLLDNTNGLSSEQPVVFPAPCYDLVTSGALEIIESGVNYAIVRGVGVLTGRQYTHTTSVVTRTTGASGKPLVKRVTDNCLVSALNSENVASRVLAYYSAAKTVGAKLMLAAEQCGDRLSFTDAFGDATIGWLGKMTMTPTSIKAAQCDIIEGYAPTGQGNTYTQRQIVTTSGAWTVPEGVTHIRAVLIGGGRSGAGGASGQTALGAGEGTVGGVGGSAGAGGTAGKIYAVSLEVQPGDVLQIRVGIGGPGGAGGVSSEDAADPPTPGEDGADGTDTTLTVGGQTWSSAAGASPVNGYFDVFDGSIYCVPGKDGVDGGSGSGPEAAGQPVEEWSPGDTPESTEKVFYWPAAATFQVRITSGYGGGAAHGADGVAGTRWATDPPITEEQEIVDSATMPTPIGGRGGAGTDAAGYTAAPGIGCGGNGGHGGGGGGTGGGAWLKTASTPYVPSGVPGEGGRGGTGSAGQDGGPGGIILYMGG